MQPIDPKGQYTPFGRWPTDYKGQLWPPSSDIPPWTRNPLNSYPFPGNGPGGLPTIGGPMLPFPGPFGPLGPGR